MHCWARYLFIAVVSLLGIGQMVAACGQKGDLYLPEPEEKSAGNAVPDAKADAASTNRAKGEPEPGDTEAKDVPQVATAEALPAAQ